MKSIYAVTVAAATALLRASSVSADETFFGCFSSTDSLTYNSNFTFNSRGICGGACLALQMPVIAMSDQFECYCGSTFPPSTDKVSNSSCTTPCPGYPYETCGGGTKYASAYLSGLTTSADFADGGSSADSNDNPSSTAGSSPSATSSSKPSVVTVIGGQTVFVTASSTATGNAKSGGSSKAGIAAGVVVGLVAVAAIVGGVFLFLKNRRKRAIEEEYRRNAAVSSFIAAGGKPPNSSGGGSSFTDMRLDPAVMAQRRMSDGSIADNQDYSRRILKVTNA